MSDSARHDAVPPSLARGRRARRGVATQSVVVKWALRITVITYLGLLLVAPVIMVFYRAFDGGIDAFWAAVTSPPAVHALKLTLIATAVSVVVNTVFGIAAALLIVRGKPKGAWLLDVIIDLPFAISPVVVGLAILLTYGETGWFGTWLSAHNMQVIFALPGIILATIFVTVPFVVREVVPVLVEIGDEQEQAAATLGAGAWSTLGRITLPSIRWGVAYGVVLTTARALGEYGAVAVVSGKVSGRTETTTVHIQQAYNSFDPVGAYGSAVVLAFIALIVLGIMTMLGSGSGPGEEE